MDSLAGGASLSSTFLLSRLAEAKALPVIDAGSLLADNRAIVIRSGEEPSRMQLQGQQLLTSAPDQPQLSVTSAQPLKSLVYEMLPTEEKTRFSNREENPLNTQLERSLKSFNDQSQWGRNAQGLGALIRSGVNSYQQRAEHSIASKSFDLGELDLDSRQTQAVDRQAELSLELTTKGGQRVSFSFAMESGGAKLEGGEHYRYEEIIVGFEVDGELSDEARKAIEDFSKQLGQFAQAFFANPERGPDLGALKLFESDQIAEISLQLKGADASFELITSETKDERRIEVSWVTSESSWADKVGRSENKLQLLLSKHGASEGKNIQQDLALSQQQAIINSSLDEGQATDQQKNYIERAFSAIHSDLYFLPPQSEEAMLTGLADYQLSFEGEWQQPMRAPDILTSPNNPLAGNQNSFLFEGLKTFELNQHTRINTVLDKTRVTQTQDMKLDAAYFRPLAHLEQVDFTNQNFLYHRIENEHQIVSDQRYDKQGLVSASITQERDYRHSVEEYSQGELIESRPNKRSSFNYVDVTELLQETLSDRDQEGRKKSSELMDRQERQQYLLLVDELFASKVFDD